MAYLFDASTDLVYSSSGLPVLNGGPYTISLWFYIVTLPTGGDSYQTLAALNTNAGSDYDQIGILLSGANTRLFVALDNGSYFENVGSTNLAVNTWYHAKLVRSSTTSLVGYLTNTAEATLTNAAPTATASRLHIGGHPGYSTDDFKGRIGAVKVWDAALASDERLDEIYSYRPVRHTSLNRWLPCFPGASERVRDFSGNARDWTEGGTLTDADGPPINWGFQRAFSHFVAASGGTLYTTSMSGGVTPTGALVKQVGKIASSSQSSAGAVTKLTSKSASGASTPSGQLIDLTSKAFSGSVSTIVGVLAKQVSKVTSGALTPTAALVRAITKFLSASQASSASLLKLIPKSFSGSVSSITGSVSTLFGKTFSGASTPTGQLVKSISKLVAGSNTPQGSVTKQTYKILSGSSTPSGALVSIRAFLLSTTGAITPSGGLLKSIFKILVGSQGSVGSATKLATKTITAFQSSSGVLAAIRAFLRSVSGSITPTGSLSEMTTRGMIGNMSPSGALSRVALVRPGGNVTITGSTSYVLMESSGADSIKMTFGITNRDRTVGFGRIKSSSGQSFSYQNRSRRTRGLF